MEAKKATGAERWGGLIWNPETGRASRKSVVLWIIMVQFTWIILAGTITKHWPPEGIVLVLGGLIPLVLGIQVYDKKNSNA